MFAPPYWNHKNIKFPKEEIDNTISCLKEHQIVGDNYSSYFYKENYPERIWNKSYDLIMADLLKSVGIYQTSKYSYKYWAQFYMRKNLHSVHNHFNTSQKNDLSFVHFLKVTETPLFRFVNLEGEYFLPKQDEGDLICFPSWVWHEVIPNESDQERLVVAGNIVINEMFQADDIKAYLKKATSVHP